MSATSKRILTACAIVLALFETRTTAVAGHKHRCPSRSQASYATYRLNGEGSNLGSALLQVYCPENSTVVINGQQMKKKGGHRIFNTRHLRLGQDYRYKVYAFVGDGKQYRHFLDPVHSDGTSAARPHGGHSRTCDATASTRCQESRCSCCGKTASHCCQDCSRCLASPCCRQSGQSDATTRSGKHDSPFVATVLLSAGDNKVVQFRNAVDPNIPKPPQTAAVSKHCCSARSCCNRCCSCSKCDPAGCSCQKSGGHKCGCTKKPGGSKAKKVSLDQHGLVFNWKAKSTAFLKPKHKIAFASDGFLELTNTAIEIERHNDLLLAACQLHSELCVEAVIKSLREIQPGRGGVPPSRIISFSQDHNKRNFTLGQERNKLVLRLNTSDSSTDGNGLFGGQNKILAPVKVGRAQHVIVSYRPVLLRIGRGRKIDRHEGLRLPRWIGQISVAGFAIRGLQHPSDRQFWGLHSGGGHCRQNCGVARLRSGRPDVPHKRGDGGKQY